MWGSGQKIKDRQRYDHTHCGFDAPLEVKGYQILGHHQEMVIRLWPKFGLDTWKPCRDMSSLPVWRPPEVKGHQIVWVSPGWCHESMYQVWLWYVKELLRTGLLPVWRLRGRIWLAVANMSATIHLLAIWGDLIVSPDIENLFEIYSCEEGGVKTHLH